MNDDSLLHGACHCGAIRLSIPSIPSYAISCNCSLCRRTGALWAQYEPGAVTVDAVPGALGAYIWGARTLRTISCKTCGSATHWESLEQQQHGRMAVNLNNFDPRLVAAVQIRRFDGADSWTFIDRP